MKLGSDTHSVDRVANDATIVVDVVARPSKHSGRIS